MAHSRSRFWPAGLRVVVRVDGPQTGGDYSVIEIEAADACAVATHVHRDEDEQIVVLDGELEVSRRIGSTRYGPGETVVLVAGAPHGLTIGAGARFLWLFRPAGLESVLAKLAEGELDDDDTAALLAAAGVTVLPAPPTSG
ncbi:MAG: cupin domain-containing protein [Solirubrobacteraceae bacterium]|nr:cupin domain-containing protein [Solirubrobacteraceae bacterium]